MVSNRKRHQRIYVFNQLMDDNFYILSGILIEKYSFRYLVNAMHNQARSTKRNPAIDLLATPGYFSVSATFLLVRILNILPHPQVLCSHPVLKDSSSL